MSKPSVMTAKAAARAIYPGTTKTVHLLFEASAHTRIFIRVPKVEARRALRLLGADVLVDLELRNAEAFIRGARR